MTNNWLLLALLVLLFSCSRGDVDPPPTTGGKTLLPFSVVVLDRAANSAIIEWSESTNVHNADTVKYKVTLQGNVVHQDLTRRRDTLLNLKPDSSYTGRVFAYTKSGDTASAPFILNKLEGYLIFGDWNDHLNSFDIFSGTRAWQTIGSAGVYDFEGVPTIVNGTIYAVSDSYGIFAFNAKTGAKLWSNNFPGEQAHAITYAAPVYSNGKLFTVIGNKLRKLNAATGALEWSFAEDNDSYYTNPVIGSGNVFVAVIDNNYHMVAVNMTTGAKSWEYPVNTQITVSPVVYNNLVIFGGTDGRIYALNQVTGALVWTRDFNVYYSNMGASYPPVIYNNMVIVYSGNFGFYGLNPATGSTIWNYKPVGTGPVGVFTVGDGRIYFVASTNQDTKAYALSAFNGTPLWEKLMPQGGASHHAPIFAKGNLYCFGGYGIYVYNATNGSFIRVVAPDYNLLGGCAVLVGDSAYYMPESGMMQ
jgi:outer membrane protein assembly factor BamB